MRRCVCGSDSVGACRIEPVRGAGRSPVPALAAFLLLASSLVFAPASPAQPRSALARDARLQRPVSISATRIYLGELLEEIMAQTGVPLQASDRLGPVSGYNLTGVVDRRPAYELLEALASLFRVPPDNWYWRPERRRGAAGYQLYNSLSWETTKEARAAFGEGFRRRQHQRRKEFFSLPPDRREAAARGDPMLAASNNPRSEGFFSFIAGLGEADLKAISGGQAREIPIGDLQPEQTQFIRDLYAQTRNLGRPGVQQPDDIQKLRLFYGPNESIVLEIGPLGGHGVLGGTWLQQAFADETYRRWIGPGESRAAPDEPVPHPDEKPRPEELEIRRETHDRLLHRLGRLGRFSVLFDCPPYVRGRRSSGGDFSLRARLPGLLANLERIDPFWKRRAPFLLFRPREWDGLERDMLVPWPVVRRLRSSAEANAGYLDLDDWLDLSVLSTDQLAYLEEEFPDTSQVRRYHVQLRLIREMNARERAALARPDGAGWSDWSDATRRRLEVLFAPEEARAIRITARLVRVPEPPTMRLFFSPRMAGARAAPIPLQPRRPREDPVPGTAP